MKLTVDVPRTFDISFNQVEPFLIGSGWKKLPYTDTRDKYQSEKYSNVYVVLPKQEYGYADEKHIMFSALRLIANVNDNCGIETVINRILSKQPEVM